MGWTAEQAEKKQTILMVHNYYQLPGGEDAVVANEKKLLESHGHRVLLYTRHNAELQTLPRLGKLLLPLAAVFNPRSYRDIKRLIREQGVELLHVHNTLWLISPAVYYAAFSCGVPVVQTVHNFRLLCPGATFYRDGHICEDCVEQGLGCAVQHSCYRGSRLQTLLCVISTKLHRRLGTYGRLHYICLTEFNRQKLLQLAQIRPERVFVKPNFVEPPAAALISEAARANQFIYAGRLDPLKGIALLLEAWRLMGDAAPKLLICGSGPLEEWCRAFQAAHPACHLELKGALSNEEVREYLATAKAAILPSQWYEGFPMSLLEAWSVGTPVLGADIGNVGALIEDGITGYRFDPASPAALAELVQQGDFRLCGSVAERFAARYTGQQNIAQLEAIYQAIDQANNPAACPAGEPRQTSGILGQALRVERAEKQQASHFVLCHAGQPRYLIALSGGKRALCQTVSTYSGRLGLLMKALPLLPFGLLQRLGLGYFARITLHPRLQAAFEQTGQAGWNLLVGTYDEKQKLTLQCFGGAAPVFLKIGNAATAREMTTEMRFLQQSPATAAFALPQLLRSSWADARSPFYIQQTRAFRGKRVAPVLTADIVKIYAEIAAMCVPGSAVSAGTAFSHGDFAPWNLKKTQAGYVLFDWEHCGVRLAGFDLMHFVLVSLVLLRGLPEHEAFVQGLANIREYLPDFTLDEAAFFAEYHRLRLEGPK